MGSLNNDVQEYKVQLEKGLIQKAYKGIMSFMSGLRLYLINKYPDYTASALYFGYMDMTYFAFTPSDLRNKQLKLAIVYLHEKGTFEIWLGGSNRKIQAEYINLMSRKNTGNYSISQMRPGVDSIIESTLIVQPDFDHVEKLKKQIEIKAVEFGNHIIAILNH